MTRRVFLASPAAMQASPTEIRLPRKLRLAIIGFDGHPGEITGQLPVLPDIEVAAIADANPAVTAREARKPRLSAARHYTDYRQMLDREKLDLVAVCNNNGERAAATLACVERKLDVIAEKPLATRRADFEKVRAAVTRQNVKLGMLLPMRFDSPYLAMKRVVSEGLIGETAQIGAQKSYKTGDRAAWFKDRKTYGSTILWIGVHMFDLMWWAGGREFKQAASFQGRVAFPEIGDMENVTSTMFRLDNGGVATLRMDYFRSPQAPTHGDDRLRIAGTEGIVEYQHAAGVTLMTSKQAPRGLTELPAKRSVFVDFLQSSYAGKEPDLPLAHIWRVNEITLAAEEAAAQGRIVPL